MKKISIILFSLIIAMLLSACGNSNKSIEDIEKAEKYNYYSYEEIKLKEYNDALHYYDELYSDENYFYYYEVNRDEEQDTTVGANVKLLKMSHDKHEIFEFIGKSNIYNDRGGIDATQIKNGNYLISGYKNVLSEYNDDELVNTVDLGKVCNLNDEECILKIETNQNKLFVLTDKNIYVLSLEYELEYSCNFDEEDEFDLIKLKDEVYIMNNQKMFFYEYMKKTLIRTSEYDFVPDFILEGSEIINGDINYDFYIDYYGDDSEHYLIGGKDKQLKRLFNFYDIGIYDAESVCPDTKGGFYLWKATGFYHIEQADEVYVETKDIITIATTNMSDISFAITRFNDFSTDKKVIIKDYASANDLYLDIVAGEKIDLIAMPYDDISMFEKNDLLLDLNEYFEGGNVLSKDDFLDNVLAMLEGDDGKIYSLFTCFYLEGFITESDFALNDMEILEKTIDSQKIVFNEFEVAVAMRSLLKYSSNRYVDGNNKKINNVDELTKYMELLKKQYSDRQYSDNYGDYLIEDKKTDFTYSRLMSILHLLYYRNMFKNEYRFENIAYSGSIIQSGDNNFAIVSSTENKKAAFDFLDFLFSKDNYNFVRGGGFSVLKSEYESDLDFYMSEECEVNDVVVTPISKEDCEWVRSLVEGAKYIEPMPDKYLDIILEEADLYFEDKKSLDDTVKAIENRVTTALNE